MRPFSPEVPVFIDSDELNDEERDFGEWLDNQTDGHGRTLFDEITAHPRVRRAGVHAGDRPEFIYGSEENIFVIVLFGNGLERPFVGESSLSRRVVERRLDILIRRRYPYHAAGLSSTPLRPVPAPLHRHR